MKRILTALSVILLSASLGGCVIAAAGAGGYIAGEEISEDDGEFDPFDEFGDEREKAEDTPEADD
ncbi:MAG: hypothetical protein AAF583_00345 [Pseudomonadota bacterium]